MERTLLMDKVLVLLYVTVAAAVAAAAWTAILGVNAGSVALVSFALVCILEMVPSALLAFRFRAQQKVQGTDHGYSIAERNVLFGIGVVFFLVALYVVNDAGSRLFYREKSGVGAAGPVAAAAAVIAFVILAVMMFRSARALEEVSVRTRASAALMLAVLAGLLLMGTGSRVLLGWWWADPASALLMVPFMLKGGWKALEESKGSNPDGSKSPRTSF